MGCLMKSASTGEGKRDTLEVQERITGVIEDPGRLQAGQIEGWNTLFRESFKSYLEKLTV